MPPSSSSSHLWDDNESPWCSSSLQALAPTWTAPHASYYSMPLLSCSSLSGYCSWPQCVQVPNHSCIQASGFSLQRPSPLSSVICSPWPRAFNLKFRLAGVLNLNWRRLRVGCWNVENLKRPTGRALHHWHPHPCLRTEYFAGHWHLAATRLLVDAAAEVMSLPLSLSLFRIIS